MVVLSLSSCVDGCCGHCREAVIVTATIDEQLYGRRQGREGKEGKQMERQEVRAGDRARVGGRRELERAEGQQGRPGGRDGQGEVVQGEVVQGGERAEREGERGREGVWMGS